MLPKRLYQVLPVLYVSIALLLLLLIDHPLRWIPGLFFALSGVMVMRWRFLAKRAVKSQGD
ncbi:MAG: hypothetical protein HWE13_00790 [Gammaproteobacteria bacterium]|nr:hypothetical protein [Gammaproteobacteria bacterium]NVK86625.1 hypothetical protein [Gammaproteobacteria bacterium]